MKLECQVVLLDNSLFVGAFEKKSTAAQVLFDRVCERLQIPEAGRCYFGLQFTDFEDGELNWLELDQPIRSQRKKPYSFQFAVKAFPSFVRKVDPALLTQFVLQVKHSLTRGKLKCPANEHAVLDACFAQLRIGDFKSEVHPCGYLEDNLGVFFAPPNGINSDIEVPESRYEALVRSLHKRNHGMSPQQACKAYLEAAEKVRFFGMSVHRGATDKDGNKVLLAVYQHGICVFDEDEFGEVDHLLTEFRWNEMVTMLSQNRKFHVVVYSEEKRDGGSFPYRFHGHYGHKAATRILKDALYHQALFYQPKLNRRSRSFGEIDTRELTATKGFQRGDKKFASTSAKRRVRGHSLSRLTNSLKKKMPRVRRSPSNESRETSLGDDDAAREKPAEETTPPRIITYL